MKQAICEKPFGTYCANEPEQDLENVLRISHEIIRSYGIWSNCEGSEGSIGHQVQLKRTGYYGRLCNVPLKSARICLADWQALNGQNCEGFNDAYCNASGMNLSTLGLDVILPLENKTDMPKRMGPLIQALNSRWKSKEGTTGLVCEECGCSGWTQWTAWSSCFPSCGLSSSKKRSRECFGEADCDGASEEDQFCNVQLCDNFNSLCNETERVQMSSMEFWEKSVIYGDTYQFLETMNHEDCFDECLARKECVAAHFVKQGMFLHYSIQNKKNSRAANSHLGNPREPPELVKLFVILRFFLDPRGHPRGV